MTRPLSFLYLTAAAPDVSKAPLAVIPAEIARLIVRSGIQPEIRRDLSLQGTCVMLYGKIIAVSAVFDVEASLPFEGK